MSATGANFTYDSIPRELGLRLLVIDSEILYWVRSGHTITGVPTMRDVTFYRSSVPAVLRRAVSLGYLVLIVGEPGERRSVLTPVISRTLRGSNPNPRILFISMDGYGIANILPTMRSSSDSIFVSSDGLPDPSGLIPSSWVRNLSRQTGALWFSPAEVFPAKPLPNLPSMAVPGKVNVYIVVSNSVEATIQVVDRLVAQGNVVSEPNLDDLFDTDLTRYIGRSVVSYYTTRWNTIDYDAIRRSMLLIRSWSLEHRGPEVLYTLLWMDVYPHAYARDAAGIAASSRRRIGDFDTIRDLLVRDPIRVEAL